MTIKFQTELQGDSIKLPENARQFVGTGKRVTVTITEEAEPKPKKKSYLQHLLENPIPVENFKPMTRDEMHERGNG